MLLASQLPPESREIAALVQKHIMQIDPTAEIILFGSRARGDAEEESDWDFLVLTSGDSDIELLASTMRSNMRKHIEVPYNVVIYLMVRNKKDWEKNYLVTDIYESIHDEGIRL